MALLKSLPALKVLNVEKTKVTARGASDFNTALPECRVEFDGGVLEGTDADRRAALLVLSLRGGVWIDGKPKAIHAPADLPKGKFVLTSVLLSETPIKDDALVAFRNLTGLTELLLFKTPITDAGLVHLQGLTTLKSLHLSGTRITEPGLIALVKTLPNLTTLYVGQRGPRRDSHAEVADHAGCAGNEGHAEIAGRLSHRATEVQSAPRRRHDRSEMTESGSQAMPVIRTR